MMGALTNLKPLLSDEWQKSSIYDFSFAPLSLVLLLLEMESSCKTTMRHWTNFCFFSFFLLQNQHIQHQQQSNSQVNNQPQPIQQTVTKSKGKHADGKPRGRMTAYAFFVQTCREEHKKKHPDEQVIFAEFSKKCAERWKVS